MPDFFQLSQEKEQHPEPCQGQDDKQEGAHFFFFFKMRGLEQIDEKKNERNSQKHISDEEDLLFLAGNPGGKGWSAQVDGGDDVVLLVAERENEGLDFSLQARFTYVFVLVSRERSFQSGDVLSEIPVLDIAVLQQFLFQEVIFFQVGSFELGEERDQMIEDEILPLWHLMKMCEVNGSFVPD